MITLTDNKGATVSFPPETTIGEMVRMGFGNLRLAKPEDPLPDDAFRESSEHFDPKPGDRFIATKDGAYWIRK